MQLDPIHRLYRIPEESEVDFYFQKNFEKKKGHLFMMDRAERLGCYGIFYRPNRFPHPPYFHNYLELKLVVSGECILAKEGKECLLESGDMFFIGPGQQYWIRLMPEKPCEMLILCFLPSVLGLDNTLLADRTRLLAYPIFEPFVREDAFFHNVLRMEADDFRRLLPVGFLVLHHFFQDVSADPGFFKSLFSLLLLQTGEYYRNIVPELRRTHRAIPRVCDYIRSHLGQPLTRENLALVANLDEHYLSRLFNRTTGESLSRFINRERLDLAKVLLGSGELSITEIALKVGFGSVGHFNHVFKETLGMTPGAFQKKSRDFK